MQKTNKIFLSSPHMSGNEQKYVQEAFDLNWIAPLGTNVDGFEREIASYNSIKDAAVLVSGTAAIHLALRLLKVGSDDTVFCSSLTFVASANPILYQDATPVLIDSEKDSWNMSPQALERALRGASEKGDLPKAVIIVHLYGQSAQMDELVTICEAYGVPIIEDAAESLGSEYKGRKSGTHGQYGIYSFNGNKIITSSGGGALISNDEEALEQARFLATQARDPAPHYQHSEVGYNYRMSNVVAGIGRGQLEVLDERVNQRRAVYNRYHEAFGHMPGIEFQPELPETMSNRWLTALTVDPAQTGVSRLEIIEKLGEHNSGATPVRNTYHSNEMIEGVTHYPSEEKNSVSGDLFIDGFSLPSGSNMSVDDQTRVIGIIKDLLDSSGR